MDDYGLKFPAFAKAVQTAVTVILAVGVLVVGITEGIIIHASFGNPEEPVDYVVVLGAKVNRDGPSVSLWDRICAAYTYLDEHPDVTAVLSEKDAMFSLAAEMLVEGEGRDFDVRDC